MNSYQVWKDRFHNRLHVVLRTGFGDHDIEAMAQQVQTLIKKLRPGFSINITSDLDGNAAPRSSSDSIERNFPAVFRHSQVSRILSTLGPKTRN